MTEKNDGAWQNLGPVNMAEFFGHKVMGPDGQLHTLAEVLDEQRAAYKFQAPVSEMSDEARHSGVVSDVWVQAAGATVLANLPAPEIA